LGDPRRVLRLHETAQIIYQNYADEVPRDLEELRSLPGVGEYTAAAIAAFAFDKPTLVLDVNVRRLFARAIDGLEEPNPSLTLLERSARSELIPTDGAKWAAATMELGALICTSKNPHCTLCPLLNECSWQSQGSPKSKFARKGQEWAGTDRQCRGVIVQALRENRELSLKALQKMWHEDSQIERALKTLIADGLIMTIGKSYMLAD
jgi:A/G-specific adenine glycosylase